MTILSGFWKGRETIKYHFRGRQRRQHPSPDITTKYHPQSPTKKRNTIHKVIRIIVSLHIMSFDKMQSKLSCHGKNSNEAVDILEKQPFPQAADHPALIHCSRKTMMYNGSSLLCKLSREFKSIPKTHLRGCTPVPCYDRWLSSGRSHA